MKGDSLEVSEKGLVPNEQKDMLQYNLFIFIAVFFSIYIILRITFKIWIDGEKSLKCWKNSTHDKFVHVQG